MAKVVYFYSVWGSPKDYIGSFNVTKVAVERRSAFLILRYLMIQMVKTTPK
ncbi:MULTISPECIES: DUF927 domain-containing protein [Peribacillus]|uniref:DUF927 domain-containing protein n=1 Tax=Peribacillus TaxID=2675229 RepID=UPI0013A5C768|nr:DUF927 domain-containing protein [Peribacillus frigoritolerans]MEC0343709.1 DUF927 domain-containing protein [Peribacillus castrilensis]